MPSSRKSWQWYWIPTGALLIGMFSLLVLLWVDRINENLRNDSGIVGAIMDLQIHAATAHLWLEQVFGGDAQVSAEAVFADLDQAIHLTRVALDGGEAEHDTIAKPLRDPELRARAEVIHALLQRLKTLAQERLRTPDQSGTGTLSDHQFDTVFIEATGKARELEVIMRILQAENQKKSRAVIMGILVVWSMVVVAAAGGLWRNERKRRVAEERLVQANAQLLTQAGELSEHREHLSDLVARRTSELSIANATLRETERQVRDLSSRLLEAQEIERSRIARELHDELGQALTVMKLNLRAMERGFGDDQEASRNDCERLLLYVDQVIENVRRLSLDLSPAVLEDLGLTSALQRLANKLFRIPDLHVEIEIAEIDHLIADNRWITVYRVMQESLTNIVRHAQAENVRIAIQPRGQKILFFIEDDGKGFDAAKMLLKNASGSGFGLRTMAERVKMLGGVLEPWSAPGQGTRIVFSIPMEKGV